ncbi:hypothetical protein RFI_05651 [Reticulomyxa filosa]|uniref:EGF domain-specific O-linked N-acetylglucosamine transferase n=1 Tax=Reticulomyxa filosa TaxID=46433 RepID=X6P069_RETFI|nr:hypothetical protein RFI_05651 [Reticulomyxa filosa]|eukprot:ETO31469.1 hypothetical protein RFI_05651 [Reticulomyxa filosa]
MIEDYCESLFGNGFSKRQVLGCTNKKKGINHDNGAEDEEYEEEEGEGYLHCYENTVSKAMYCDASNLVIDSSAIAINSFGGESIESVLNRDEDDEYPRYNSHSFLPACALSADMVIPERRQFTFYQHDVLSAIQKSTVILRSQYAHLADLYCHPHPSFPSSLYVFTTRYEYANLYHTATDWYNMFQILRTLGIRRHSFQVFLFFFVFDGHPWGALDEAWTLAFANFTYIKRIHNSTQPYVCANRAIFVPSGYIGGLALKYHKCLRASRYVQEFAQWFLEGFGLKPTTNRIQNKIQIVLICRKDYIPHPRKPSKKVGRKFKSDVEVEKVLKEIVIDGFEINVNRVYLEEVNIQQQLKVISSTDVLIGVHGAGMTHVLFLPPKSGVIEIVPQLYSGRMHFQYLSTWAGHVYEKISAAGSDESIHPNFEQLKLAVQKVVVQILT